MQRSFGWKLGRLKYVSPASEAETKDASQLVNDTYGWVRMKCFDY